MKPPVVKFDMATANAHVWGHRPLGAFMGDFEKLLMIDPDAPVAFDSIPMRTSQMRSKALVDVFSRSFQANPELKPMLQRVGGALKADRVERTGRAEDLEIEEAVAEIRRQVEVKPSYRPRA